MEQVKLQIENKGCVPDKDENDINLEKILEKNTKQKKQPTLTKETAKLLDRLEVFKRDQQLMRKYNPGTFKELEIV